MAALAAGLLALLALVGCGDDTVVLQPGPARPTPTIAPYSPGSEAAPGRAALSLIPADATAVTITDFDESRAQLGVPELTSAATMSERTAYWERARAETVLLAEGMLRADNSLLMLDYGFTQDDVDWEAHFTTPSGAGWILGLRPDLDLAGVRRAVADKVAGLGRASVDEERHLVSVGMATDGEETWADLPGVLDVVNRAPAEATYYRSGCVPVATALGPDVSSDDLADLLAEHDPTLFEPVERFGVSVVDGFVSARFGRDRTDLFARSAFATDAPGRDFRAAFEQPVVDPSTGRLGYRVTSAPAAAGAILGDELPFAACPETVPIESATGL